MPSTSAAYMRAYRAKRKAEGLPVSGTPRQPRGDFHALEAENARLTAEVERLRVALASRPILNPGDIIAPPFIVTSIGTADRNPFAEFRPAPKPGKGK